MSLAVLFLSYRCLFCASSYMLISSLYFLVSLSFSVSFWLTAANSSEYFSVSRCTSSFFLLRVYWKLDGYFASFRNSESGGNKCWKAWGSGIGSTILQRSVELRKGYPYIDSLFSFALSVIIYCNATSNH